jgi:hypothetical protein
MVAEVRAFRPGVCVVETNGNPLLRARVDYLSYADYLTWVEEGIALNANGLWSAQPMANPVIISKSSVITDDKLDELQAAEAADARMETDQARAELNRELDEFRRRREERKARRNTGTD